MHITLIFGAMAMVAAVAALCWGLTASPSKARANLFAGLPQPAAPAGASDTIMHRVGTDMPFAISAGFSYAGNRNNAARVGIAGEF